MTETTAPTPTPDEDTLRPPDRTWMLIAAVMAVAALFTVAVVAFAVGRNDNNAATPTATQQIAGARKACQQWFDSDTTASGAGPRAGWCDDVSEWMSSHMGSGGTMMGTGMWASPQAMRDVCVRAMGSARGANGNAAQWCDQMVDWMSQHRGNWDHWDDNWNR